jgi:tetratricopeptide (TPR) repeat protein
MRHVWVIYLVLLLITSAVFWPVTRDPFIDLDDKDYVVENPHVQQGLTPSSAAWAFQATVCANWHPLTWLSHMLDCQLFGLNAGAHHLVNLLFHVANMLLLFHVLRIMTRKLWPSAMIAALFALHPLHVESVAWVAERKDVLCGFFFLLSLWAYTRYAQGRSRVESRESSAGSGSLATDPRPSTLDYFLALVFFALGLMSKPMLVSLPLILLLLDCWPLGRWRPMASNEKNRQLILPPASGNLEHLIIEKLPFIGLSLASCIVTIWAQGQAGAIVPFDHLSWDRRIENSLVSYTAYLGKMFWPANLSLFYPYTQIHPWEAVLSGLLLIVLSVYFIRRARFQPYLLTGWLWFLVTLVPVIGLVQAGGQSMADRYTYLPSIGLFMMVGWGLADLAAISRFWRTITTLGAAGLPLACLLVTRHQLSYWRNNVALFSHVLEVTGESALGNFYLGDALWKAGDADGAIKNFQISIQKAPDFKGAHHDLGFILFHQKKFEAAATQFKEVLRIYPDDVNAHMALGYSLANQGKFADSEAEFSAALQLNPDNMMIRDVLTLVAKKAEAYQALASLYEALKIQPTPEIHAQIAVIQARQGEFQEAIGHYTEALRLRPDLPDVLNNLAWMLATCPEARIRDGVQAVKYAERACELTHYQKNIYLGTLAAAYAEAGRFDDAIAMAQKACALASESGDPDLLKKNRELLALYLKRQPYHEATEKLVPAAP